MQWIFHVYDKDGSETLTHNELHALLTDLHGGWRPPTAQMRRIFEVVDRDGSGTLTADEVLEAIRIWFVEDELEVHSKQKCLKDWGRQVRVCAHGAGSSHCVVM